VCLNWNDASAYAQWLTETTGKEYRLLTEAEWEYAARAKTSPGSYPRFFFGGDENDLCRHINAASCLDAAQNPFPVGSFPANDFGLHDMAGNAWQWTQDCYHNSYRGAPADGAAWDTEDCTQHILRGGSWASMPKNLRAAVRGSDDTAGNGWDQAGFRVARTLLTP
jgi:formylglycine-generating enzyme required for sulfatase activity